MHLTPIPAALSEPGRSTPMTATSPATRADFEGFLGRAAEAGYREDAVGDDPMRMIVRRNSLAGFQQVYLLDPDRNIIEVNGAS